MQIEALVGMRTRIISSLSSALKEASISAQVDPTNGSIALESDVMFELGSYDLSERGERFIDRFLPVYLDVLFSEEYRSYVSEILIQRVELAVVKPASAEVHPLQPGQKGRGPPDLRQILRRQGLPGKGHILCVIGDHPPQQGGVPAEGDLRKAPGQRLLELQRHAASVKGGIAELRKLPDDFRELIQAHAAAQVQLGPVGGIGMTPHGHLRHGGGAGDGGRCGRGGGGGSGGGPLGGAASQAHQHQRQDQPDAPERAGHRMIFTHIRLLPVFALAQTGKKR